MSVGWGVRRRGERGEKEGGRREEGGGRREEGRKSGGEFYGLWLESHGKERNLSS